MNIKTQTLSFKITFLLVVTLLATSAILLTTNYFEAKNRFLENLKSEADYIKKQYDFQLNEKLKNLSIALEILSNSEDILKLVESGDRDNLREKLYPLYLNKLKKDYGISQFQFHTPNNYSFFRVHEPDRYGDDLSKFRATVVKANAEKIQVSGLEVGKFGAGLRNVVPLNYKGSHLGTLEFSASLESILDFVSKAVGAEYSISIFDEVFSKTNREKQSNDLIVDNLIYYHSSDPENLEILKDYKVSEEITLTEHSDDMHVVFSFPIEEFDGSKIGYFTIFKDVSDVYSAIWQDFLIKLIVMLVITFVVALFLTTRLRQELIKPVNSLHKAAMKIANGNYDFNLTVKKADEIGQVRQAFNDMIENVRVKQKELLDEKESIQTRINQAVAESDRQKSYLTQSVAVLLNGMDKFADGDLSVKLDVTSNDEIGRLYEGFNKTVVNIGRLVNQLIDVIETITRSASQISSATEEIAAGANQQSAQTNEVAAAVEQMTKTIYETSKNAVTASQNAKSSSNSAQTGVNRIVKAKEGMGRITGSSQETAKVIEGLAQKTDQIGEIAQVIDDIADQTNLLALNAAIEAARAGEHGRGFAVVADEVRKLAERTTKATKEIADTIRAIQVETKKASESMLDAKDAVVSGNKLNDEVEDALKSIYESAQQVAIEIDQVAAASEQQSSTSEEISKNIEAISTVTNETAKGIQEIATTAEDLNSMIEQLHSLVQQFNLDNTNKSKQLNAYSNNKYLTN